MRYRNKSTGKYASKRQWSRSHGPGGKYVRVPDKPREREEPPEPPGPPPEPIPPPPPEPPEEPIDQDWDIDLGKEEYGEVSL